MVALLTDKCTIIMLLLGLSCIFVAFFVVVSQHPIYSLLFLILLFFIISLLLLLCNLGFFSFVYLIIYAGAIFVLFIFVIMMLNLKRALLFGDAYAFKIFFIFFVIVLLLICVISYLCSYELAYFGDSAVDVFNQSDIAFTPDVMMAGFFITYSPAFVLIGVILFITFLAATIITEDFRHFRLAQKSNNVTYKKISNSVYLVKTKNHVKSRK